MYFLTVVLVLSVLIATGELKVCDQTPPQARGLPPSLNKGIYELSIVTKGNDSKNIYVSDQTYILILKANDRTRPFRWFMITVEDPDADNSTYESNHRPMEAGSLKTLGSHQQSRYSESCFNTVESADNSEKYQIEVHWLSPKMSDKKQKVRLRATVAENGEVWYTGEYLTIFLDKDDRKPLDSPPYPAKPTCNLCSEARYEVLFEGRWSRMSHPRHYPSKPDDNGYSHMVGASHAYEYKLWQQGDNASKGLKLLAEKANSSVIEREIIDEMRADGGTRTLIRGKRRHHPYMFEPSHSLFRVDYIHHLFSIAVAMKPSPDWFLGVSKFELCADDGWLEESTIPLYPWDAGTMDGISYETPPVVTIPTDPVNRVEVGSFNVDSPFYQMDLIDLKPFGHIKVRKLAEYQLNKSDCGGDQAAEQVSIDGGESTVINEEPPEEPVLAEYKSGNENCMFSEWSEWSDCALGLGNCGGGTQIRSRHREYRNLYFDGYRAQDNHGLSYENCKEGQDETQLQSQYCYVDCY